MDLSPLSRCLSVRAQESAHLRNLRNQTELAILRLLNLQESTKSLPTQIEAQKEVLSNLADELSSGFKAVWERYGELGEIDTKANFYVVDRVRYLLERWEFYLHQCWALEGTQGESQGDGEDEGHNEGTGKGTERECDSTRVLDQDTAVEMAARSRTRNSRAFASANWRVPDRARGNWRH